LVLGIAVCGAADDLEAALSAGKRALAAGDLPGAHAQFARAEPLARTTAGRISALQQRGACELREQRPDAARVTLERGLALFNGRIDWPALEMVGDLARAVVATEGTVAAAACYGRWFAVFAANPGSPPALLAHLQLRKANLLAAGQGQEVRYEVMAEFDRATELAVTAREPSVRYWCLFHRAGFRASNGDRDGAIRDYQEGLAIAGISVEDQDRVIQALAALDVSAARPADRALPALRPAAAALFLFQPRQGFLADIIPFAQHGRFHIFYLTGGGPGAGSGHSWAEIVTPDLVTYEDWGIVIRTGDSVEARDLNVWTGSVVERDGVYHAFYTGHNPNFAGTATPTQVVQHATSPDLRAWSKDPGFELGPALDRGYALSDWRDPFVFQRPGGQDYGMLITAAYKGRPALGLAVSRDLRTWTVEAPFAEFPPASGIHGTECSDLFELDGTWYLLCSSGRGNPGWATRYLLAERPEGPWTAPPENLFDGGLFYAAKTAASGKRRLLFGWLAARAGQSDNGASGWGGNLLYYEVSRRPDGRLATRIPAEVIDAFAAGARLQPQPGVLPPGWAQAADGGFMATDTASPLPVGTLPARGLLEVEVSVGATPAALLVGASRDLSAGFRLELDPVAQRLSFNRFPTPAGADQGGERPWRPLALTPGKPVRLQIILDGTCFVACADGTTCLSGRLYDRRDDAWGISGAGADFRAPALQSTP
jgi:beta-fructofuranosidase